jgi:hypothetical protein
MAGFRITAGIVQILPHGSSQLVDTDVVVGALGQTGYRGTVLQAMAGKNQPILV